MASEKKEKGIIITGDAALKRGGVRTHPADESLIDAAAGVTDEVVELNPSKLREMSEMFDKRRKAERELMETVMEKLPPYIKIAVTAWVFKQVVDHAKERETFRYWIYERMGFGTEAYMPLWEHGGIIHNNFELAPKEMVDKTVEMIGRINDLLEDLAGQAAMKDDSWKGDWIQILQELGHHPNLVKEPSSSG